MRRFNLIGFGLWLGVCLAGGVRAETFQLLDGNTITGDIVLPATAETVNFKIGEGKYQRVGWTNFTQAALQEMLKNPKLTQYAEPYIEISDDTKAKKTEVVIKPPERLERPPKGSLFGALTNSSVGLVCLLLLYAANIYAGYEVSVIRAYSPALVCGISAILPVIGPIIFLCVPTKMKSLQDEEIVEETPVEAAPVGEAVPAEGEAQAAGGLSLAREQAGPALPETQVFKRGQYTFNRRFIETKFSGFFGVARHGADKDMVLLVKSARGEYVVSRVSRIAANDMHVEVRKGAASAEIQIPFVEITEIHLKHKDA